MLKKFYYQQLQCTSERDPNVITQPNLSRTIRQILADTAAGKPSPVPLQPAPNDSEVYKDMNLHKLHVCEDKFDSINRHRDYIHKTEKKVSSNRKKLSEAEKAAKDATLKAAEERGFARGSAKRSDTDE